MDGYALLLNIIDIDAALPIEIIPGHSLGRTSAGQVDEIKHPGLDYGRPEACKVLLARHLATAEELGLDASTPAPEASCPQKKQSAKPTSKPVKRATKRRS